VTLWAFVLTNDPEATSSLESLTKYHRIISQELERQGR